MCGPGPDGGARVDSDSPSTLHGGKLGRLAGLCLRASMCWCEQWRYVSSGSLILRRYQQVKKFDLGGTDVVKAQMEVVRRRVTLLPGSAECSEATLEAHLGTTDTLDSPSSIQSGTSTIRIQCNALVPDAVLCHTAHEVWNSYAQDDQSQQHNFVTDIRGDRGEAVCGTNSHQSSQNCYLGQRQLIRVGEVRWTTRAIIQYIPGSAWRSLSIVDSFSLPRHV